MTIQNNDNVYIKALDTSEGIKFVGCETYLNNNQICFRSLEELSSKRKKRLCTKLLDYIQNNDFKYVFSLCSEKEEDLSNGFKLFIHNLKKKFKDVKVLAVLRKFKNGKLHYYGFIGNCKLDYYLCEQKFFCLFKNERNNDLDNQGFRYVLFNMLTDGMYIVKYNKHSYFKTNNLSTSKVEERFI